MSDESSEHQDLSRHEERGESTSLSDLVRAHVVRVITPVQQQYARGSGHPPTSAAVQTLATLRRASGSTATADPRVWAVVLKEIPERLMGAPGGRLTEPTSAERAVFTALTTYAVHQQSQRQGMHQPGVGLGVATRLLAGQRSRDAGRLDDGTIERMHKVSLAQTPELRAQALRSLVTLMRSAERPVALDYGRLAQDLFWLQNPRHAHRVHLAWGRDLHRRSRDEPPQGGRPTSSADTGHEIGERA